eukprot:4467503-Prymnesium_polylepis.2
MRQRAGAATHCGYPHAGRCQSCCRARLHAPAPAAAPVAAAAWLWNSKEGAQAFPTNQANG